MTATVGYSGKVGGITFDDGVPAGGFAAGLPGSVADYFRRKGYRLEGGRMVRDRFKWEQPDARDAGDDGSGIRTIGTRLRDASVKPEAQDFLPPTNAGAADPHGPEVVSPGLHAVEGVRPVAPGVVPPPPPQQEAKETAATAAATSTTAAADLPKKGDKVADWRAYAISQGLDPDEAATLSKPKLVERFGKS